MKLAKHLVPRPLKDRYLDLKRRLDQLELSVRGLETALDAMLVNPKYIPGDDVGFNGQLQRKRIFGDVCANIAFDAIVETGTWIGNTTAYMALNAHKPVYTCELNPRFQAIARMRLADVPGTNLQLGDSRSFLQNLSAGTLVLQSVFFYLDAHWYNDLPLGEEVDLIASRWKRFVIMIDDFKVSDDKGYTYDDYGEGKALALPLIQPALKKHRLGAFFPAAKSQDETGSRRGCVIVGSSGEMSDKLARLASLRPAA